jgi:hypothetical protein
MVITFFHTKYYVGMAQCLILDGLRPRWKEEMRQKGVTQFTILERLFTHGKQKHKSLVGAAKRRFGYDEILAGQNRLVEGQVAILRGFLEAQGRRYRIYHWEIPGEFRWKPCGPVHTVPNWLMQEIDEKLEADSLQTGPTITSNVGPMIWEGGIARLEKGDLIFESQAVPILCRYDYFEWIDADPAADRSDIALEWSRREGDVYYDLRLETDGFVLHVPRARIDETDRVVAIHPMVEQDLE